MMKKFIVKIFILIMLPVLSHGAEGKELVDLEKYHKLQTSSVYFSSVKGRPVHLGVGFYKDDREAYFPGLIDNEKIFGSVTVFCLKKNNEPKIIKFARGPWSIRFKSGAIKEMLFMTSLASLAIGEYLVVYDIYVLKDIPSDLNNIVMVSEKTTWK